ncbi:hypothetical protein PTTG_07209 [Puccinia triticina 1-1 BBBD Race 1]|uniref:Uncharacterized protein n=1 Tax=Puccinia triticina (isolate 1-1 / race 1 (BBBD)) TaxID=630390 RepID=A0A180GXV8_PUCT1|nr:hypothetical protein PTTG_07209 [Puccinia triticina 1-1 BBBD Race 1]
MQHLVATPRGEFEKAVAPPSRGRIIQPPRRHMDHDLRHYGRDPWRCGAPTVAPLSATVLRAAPSRQRDHRLTQRPRGGPGVGPPAPPSEAAVRPSRPRDFMAVRPGGSPEATPGGHDDALSPLPQDIMAACARGSPEPTPGGHHAALRTWRAWANEMAHPDPAILKKAHREEYIFPLMTGNLHCTWPVIGGPSV